MLERATMIRRLTARSIIVASAAAIFGVLQYYYGIESLGLGMVTTVLPETTEPIKLEGSLHSGFHAGRYYSLRTNGTEVQGLHFDYDSKRLTLYIGHREIPNQGMVVVVRGDLPLFIQKDTSAGYEGLPYLVSAARVPVVTADHLELPGPEALVRATWTERKGDGNWRLQLRGAPGQTGKVKIVVPASLPVFSDASLPTIPMIVSVASPFIHSDEFRTCLESIFSTAKVYAAPSDRRAQDHRSLELDLEGNGIDLIAYPDMKPTSDSSTSEEVGSCRNSRSPWLNLNEDERMERYRSELSATGALETILTAYR
jgi:hypothetical protein